MSAFKDLIKSLPGLRQLLAERDRFYLDHQRLADADYDADYLAVWEKSVDFLKEPRFQAAYRAGIEADNRKALNIEWRVYTCCWAAAHAAHLAGDFVECGVNTGATSVAICNYIDFNVTGKSFFLFDTYEGIPETQMTETERPGRLAKQSAIYEDCYDQARRNFEPFPKAQLVRGEVPGTLDKVEIDRVCYLHLDMNIAYPERAALEYFWPKLSSGAPVVLDDYGWREFREQKLAIDDLVGPLGVSVMTLPTGQGLLLKP